MNAEQVERILADRLAAVQAQQCQRAKWCRHAMGLGQQIESAEAALATASREKLRLQDEVEAVVEDMERRADGSGGTYEDAVRRSVCKRYAIDLRAALASPSAREVTAEDCAASHDGHPCGVCDV